MKKFIIITTFLLACTGFVRSQDTLVKKDGTVMPGFIAESDSDMITLGKTDSLAEELNLIQRAELLFIKHRNGNVESFFTCDTILTTTGSFVLCKVLEVNPGMIVTFSYNGKVNGPTALPRSSVLMIMYHNGLREVMVSQQQSDVNANTLNDNDAYAQGEKDAEKYYRTSGGAIAGSVFCGTTTYVYGTGIVGQIIIVKHEPVNLHNSANPNDHLLSSDKSYHDGYLHAATRKRNKDCWKAYGCGLVLPVAATAVLVVILISAA